MADSSKKSTVLDGAEAGRIPSKLEKTSKRCRSKSGLDHDKDTKVKSTQRAGPSPKALKLIADIEESIRKERSSKRKVNHSNTSRDHGSNQRVQEIERKDEEKREIDCKNLIAEIEANIQTKEAREVLSKRKKKNVKIIVNGPKSDLYGLVPSQNAKRIRKRRQPSQTTSSSTYFMYEKLDEEKETKDKIESLIQDIKKLKSKETSATSWGKRKTIEECNWANARQDIFHILISNKSPSHPQKCERECEDNVSIWCQDCLSYICCAHDLLDHKFQPFHRRQNITAGFRDPLAACHALQPSPSNSFELCFTERYPPFCQHATCSCGQKLNSSESTILSSTKVTAVTLRGRHEIFLPRLLCSICGSAYEFGLEDVLSNGFWPSNPKLHNGCYLFDTEVLSHFDILRKEAPSLSIRGFLRTLQTNSFAQSDPVQATLFTRTLAEYQKYNFEESEITNQTPLECPACSTDMHAVHIDGNRKLYRFHKQNQVQCEENYYKNTFIDDDGMVDHFVQKIQRQGVKGDDSMCGEGHWRAAKARSKTMKNLSEVGLVMGCCRHAILLKAINMKQGEIFPYPMYIHKAITQKFPTLTFICQDVICKYFPWLQKIARKFPDDEDIQALTKNKPFLSVMHGQSHGWSCQILWGGRYQEQSCAQAGEEMETVNQYMSRGGFISKNMSATNREEWLTQMALHWNQKKIEALPVLFDRWWKKLSIKQEQANHHLQSIRGNATEDEIEEWIKELKAVAQSKDLKQTIEDDRHKLFKLHSVLCDHKLLSDFVSNQSDELAILRDTLSLRKQAGDRTLAQSTLKSKQREYQELLTKLSGPKSETEILDEAQKHVAKIRLERLLDEIQMIHHQVMQRQVTALKESDTSKKRAYHRRITSKLKLQLKDKINQYNSIRTLADPPFEKITLTSQGETDVLAGELPRLKFKREVADAFVLTKRLAEERLQLLKEMKAAILYHDNQANALAASCDLTRTTLEAGVIPPLNPIGKPGRYQPKEATRPYVQGYLALLNEASTIANKRAAHLLLSCQQAVGNQDTLIFSDSESDTHDHSSDDDYSE